jgi:BON domain
MPSTRGGILRSRRLALVAAATAAATYLFDRRAGSARRRRLRASIERVLPRGVGTSAPAAPLPPNFVPTPSEQARAESVRLEEKTEEVATALADLGIDPSIAETASDPLADEPGPVELPSTSLDDATVVQRLRSTLTQRRDLRTDELVVDVVNGVVYLSGELRDPQTFGEIVDLTRETPGVRRVQSLLHLPGDETP